MKRAKIIEAAEQLLSFLLVLTLAFSAVAQTGGGYNLSHNVVASGGGSNSTGGTFKVDGTTGQPLAGTVSTGGSFNLRGGFWAFESAPTASTVFIAGRVTNSEGEGISGVKIILQDTFTNITRTTTTNEKGYYMFEELEVLHFYIVSAKNKMRVFAPESYSLELTGSREDVNFIVERLRFD
jgi:hypothetical protein